MSIILKSSLYDSAAVFQRLGARVALGQPAPQLAKGSGIDIATEQRVYPLDLSEHKAPLQREQNSHFVARNELSAGWLIPSQGEYQNATHLIIARGKLD